MDRHRARRLEWTELPVSAVRLVSGTRGRGVRRRSRRAIGPAGQETMPLKPRPCRKRGCVPSHSTPKTIAPASHQSATVAGPEPVITAHVGTYPPQSTRTQVVLRQWRTLVSCGHPIDQPGQTPIRVSQTASAITRPRPAFSAAWRTSAGSGPLPCRQRSSSRSTSSARFEMKSPGASGEGWSAARASTQSRQYVGAETARRRPPAMRLRQQRRQFEVLVELAVTERAAHLVGRFGHDRLSLKVVGTFTGKAFRPPAPTRNRRASPIRP